LNINILTIEPTKLIVISPTDVAPNGALSLQTSANVQAAVNQYLLYKARKPNLNVYFIILGGNTNTSTNYVRTKLNNSTPEDGQIQLCESSAIQNELIRQGVNSDNIITETYPSKNTVENAQELRRIITAKFAASKVKIEIFAWSLMGEKTGLISDLLSHPKRVEFVYER
jgi:DUF218 domain